MAKSSIIYNKNIATDNIQLLSYINDFTKGLGEDLIEIDASEVYKRFDIHLHIPVIPSKNSLRHLTNNLIGETDDPR